uniref:Uncharacterized protein n=1 Tax=Anguilla anguilla TaxID=7936 RepID=A0A0E9WI04_ANGAN
MSVSLLHRPLSIWKHAKKHAHKNALFHHHLLI